jgi:basic amino acid/polyamine antiporter, APA family
MGGGIMENKQPKLKRELGLLAAISIVVGNTIASGIFVIPQNLAANANPTSTMVAWVITITGSLLLALSFSNLASKFPSTGGCIVYTEKAFGSFAAFLVSWTYWIALWVGNAAVITAMIRYVGYIVPIVGDNKLIGFIVASLVLWGITFINISGVKNAGSFQIITTICKLFPLLIFVILAAFNFHPEYFTASSSPEVSSINTVPSAIAVTLWALVGFESSTTVAGEIKNPEKNLKRSTLYGTLIVAIVYILVSAMAIGVMPQSELAKSEAPIADMMNLMTGSTWGGFFISIAVIVSTIGALNSGILIAARSAFAAAENNLFPKIFGNIDKKFFTPKSSLIISGIAMNIVLIMNCINGLNSAYNFLILLATLAFLVAYGAGAAAEIVLIVQHDKNISVGNFIKNSILPLLGFVYVLYAIYGSGAETVMWGFISMLIGIPLYIYIQIQKKNT